MNGTPNRRLILTVGLPRSGKTTWARSTGWPMVNPDAIRLALHGERFVAHAEPMVWVLARYMVRALFLAGHDTVVVDATHNSRKRRDLWRPGAEDPWERVLCKLVATPRDTCIARALESNDHVIIPVIDRMDREREPLAEAFEDEFEEERE